MASASTNPETWPSYTLTLTCTVRTPSTNVVDLATLTTEARQALNDALTQRPTVDGSVRAFTLTNDGERAHGPDGQLVDAVHIHSTCRGVS